MISVIVPAHNEEAVIRRNLYALTKGAKTSELEVIVVCNGCEDSTAQEARKVAGPIQVVETSIASKTNALNLGDRLATGFPRFYVDADLVFCFSDLLRVAAVLEENGFLAAAPEFEFNLSQSSRAVKAYYRVWKTMPYFDTGRIAGAYGLSREGRSRFGVFPEVTSDDGFVRLQYAPHERVTVHESSVLVNAPKTLLHLIKIKTRSHGGSSELRKKYPALFSNETASPLKSLKRLFDCGLPFYDVAVYFFVSCYAKLRGRINRLSGSRIWERDESSRY